MTTPEVNELLASVEGVASTAEQKRVVNGIDWLHVVAPAALPGVARMFREAGHMLELYTCLDYLGTECLFRLVLQFTPPGAAERHRVTVDVPSGSEAPTISGVYASANWQEREIWDMFGLRFAGHPNLERLLMPEDSTWHPLLKGFNDPSAMPAAESAAGGSDGAS
jgi:NADH-quinone oxidoreductase subunit C